MRKIKIGQRFIGKGCRCFIIAEIGINHNGRIALAKRLIDAAKDSGADAVKFQTFTVEKFVTKNTPFANYQKGFVNAKSQFDMLKKIELSKRNFGILKEYCEKKDIEFLSTPFDEDAADFLVNELNVKLLKISSSDLTNLPFLSKVVSYGRPLILSTGMSSLLEVKEAVQVISLAGNNRLILLHCTSNYPANFRAINLNAMLTLKKEFGFPVGYSDHSKSIEVSIAAVAMGGCVVEKHITLSKKLPGPDHRASLEPSEFKSMVDSIRNVEDAMGDGIKRPMESEKSIRNIVRKSIVIAADATKGTRLKRDMLLVKRPGTGIAPKFINRVLEKKLKLDITKDTVLTWPMLK